MKTWAKIAKVHPIEGPAVTKIVVPQEAILGLVGSLVQAAQYDGGRDVEMSVFRGEKPRIIVRSK